MPTVPRLEYRSQYVDAGEHDALLAAIDAVPWAEDLKRRVQHYGYRYDYRRRSVDGSAALGPLPGWADRFAVRLLQDGITSHKPDQLIVNEYLPGQGIAPHIDCEPCFGDTLCSLSLGAPCVMLLTHVETGRQEPILLEPCSLLILQGEARYAWKHGIPARKADLHEGHAVKRGRRVSLTFRTVILDGT